MYRRRDHVAGAGPITARALELYREGLAIKPGKHYERGKVSRKLAEELRLDLLFPCLLDSAPVFLLAVPDEAPYRERWAELKAELEEAANG